MPFDPSGNFSRMHSWQQDRDNGIRILADRHDEEDDNFGNAFNLTFLRTGTVPMTGNLVMGGNAIKLIKAGSEAAPGLSFELSNQTGIWQPNPTTIAVSSNGVKKFEVNGTGVGIFGDTSFGGNVVVGGSVTAPGYNITGVTGAYIGSTGTAPNIYPMFAFDANDYLYYNRDSNTLGVTIGGAAITAVTAAGYYINGLLDVASGLTTLHNGLSVGGTASASVSMSAPSFAVSTFSNCYLGAASGTSAVLGFDANDYILYDRTNNVMNFSAGGVGIGAFTATGFYVSGFINASGAVNATQLTLDTTHYIQTPGGNPYHVVDTGDYWRFTRASNVFEFIVGEVVKLSISPAGVSVGGNAAVTGDMDITGSLVVHWNLTVVSALYLGTSGNSYINADAGWFTISMDNGDYIQYDKVGNIMSFSAAGAVQLRVQPGAAFVPNLLYIADSNFYMNLNGNYANINMNANCVFRYNRAGAYEFVLNGSVPLTVHGSDITVAGDVVNTGRMWPGGVIGLAGRHVVQDYGGCALQTWTGSGDYTCAAFNRLGVQVGSITCNASNTFYNASSDMRLKDNIEDALDSGPIIDALKVRQFDWKESGEHVRFGVVAQELLEVYPEAIHILPAPTVDDAEDDDSDPMLMWDRSMLTPLLLAEVKALRARVDFLEKANRGRH